MEEVSLATLKSLASKIGQAQIPKRKGGFERLTKGLLLEVQPGTHWGVSVAESDISQNAVKTAAYEFFTTR